jgi:hypothetical protein
MRPPLDASKEVGLELNSEETLSVCSCLASEGRMQGKKHNVMIANRSFENSVTFRYLGTIITHENNIYEVVKSTSNSGNAYNYRNHYVLLSII